MDEVVEVERPRGSLVGWLLKGGLALGASVGAFWWAFHDVDLTSVTEELKGSSVAVLLTFLVVQLALHGLRVVRWGLLIKPLGPATNRAVFAAASVGFPATFFLPLRLGEFVRPVMISRSGVPFAGAMASVVVERVADGVVNLGLFFLFLRMLPASAPVPDDLRTFSLAALVLFGGALVFLVLACVARRPALSLVERLLSPISETLASRVLGLLDTFIHGVMVLRTPARILGFVSLSLLYWLLNGLVTWYLAQSYIPELPVLAGPFTISVVVFAIMIPAGPAFAGTLEAGCRFGMAPFGIDASAAAVVALAMHALQLVLMAILAGAGFMAAESRQTHKPAPGPDAP
ncbi:MAG: flippase-like domain-containing protein [Myxococcales bacterium]|nr:flippase-like domain-containing protein [Myxococcales bacterium]